MLEETPNLIIYNSNIQTKNKNSEIHKQSLNQKDNFPIKHMFDNF